MNTANEFLNNITDSKGVAKQAGNFSLAIYGGFFPGAFRPYMSELYDFDFGTFVLIGRENYAVLFFDLEVYEKTTRYGWERYKKAGTKDNFSDYIKYQEIKALINNFYQKMMDEVAALSNEELLAAAKKAFDYLSRLLVTTVFCEAYQDAHIKKFFGEIETKTTSEDKFLQFAALPAFTSFVTEFDILLIEKDPIKDWKDLLWIYTDYYAAIDKNLLVDKVKQSILDKGGVDKVKAEIVSNKSVASSQQSEIEVFALGLSLEEKTLLSFTQEAMEIRDRRKESLQKIMTLQYALVSQFLRNKNIDVALAPFCSCYDFIDETCVLPDFEADLLKRKSSFLLYADKDKHFFEYDAEVISKVQSEILKVIEGDKITETSELTGSIGCKGFAKGIVKVIHSQSDFGNFEDGDILVTSMTRPEFVPLMKMAAGIVTDEGGITCHAAIVSRELKIPCIIGTKFATSKLKTGDIVEVDANKGVVRILRD